MAEESDLEKTEPASDRRLEKAREDGDIPRSRDFATALTLLVTGVCLWAMGANMSHSLQGTLKTFLGFGRDAAFDSDELFRLIKTSALDTFLVFIPFGLVAVAACVVAPLLVGGWVFTPKGFMPRFGKLNPLTGLANMVSKNSLAELLKAVLKTVVVGVAAWAIIGGKVPELARMTDVPADVGVSKLGRILWEVYIAIVGALVAIGVLDAAYQKWHYSDRMKMSRQELKDEAKESEGNPEIKAKLRQQQREMARRRMMSEVPKADVVITNPTHYAVALKYSESGNSAPRVVAKGIDAVAEKIKEVAADSNVLLMEAPPLARALYANAELGDEIPEVLYSAVAEVLAYVFQLRKFNQGVATYPDRPSNIPVPLGMDPLDGASGAVVEEGDE